MNLSVICRSACARRLTHIVHVAILVGPVWGAAVARLVDLALLLQAAGLTALARTTLYTKFCKTPETN